MKTTLIGLEEVIVISLLIYSNLRQEGRRKDYVKRQKYSDRQAGHLRKSCVISSFYQVETNAIC